ncbi:MAG: YtxH domain-containing protein [bacterium]
MCNNNDDSTSVGSLLAGIVVGAAIGTVVGMLYAPKPGKELRADINVRLEELKARMDEVAGEVTELAKTRIAETREDIAQAVEAGRLAASERLASLKKETNTE